MQTKYRQLQKKAGKATTILIAMRMRQYDVGRIAQWSTSGASLKATGCRHRASEEIRPCVFTDS